MRVPTDDGRPNPQNPSDVDAQMDEPEQQDSTNDMDMGHVGSL